MSKHIRLTVVGLIGAVGGFGLQGCFAPQPTPECSVTITAAALGLGPYYTKLARVDGTGTCSQLDHMQTGLQRFRTAPSGGAFKLAVKTSPVTDPFLGYVFSADTDPFNNCVNEDDCQGEDDQELSCVINVADGGVELFDGRPVTIDGAGDGTAEQADGGVFPIDLANECQSVPEPVKRRDPLDPPGAKLIATGEMPQFPNAAGVCAVTNFSGGEQNFQPEVLDLADGSGQVTLPAVTYKTEFTNFNVINTAKIPGTVFTADVKYTEGGCVANYKALGFWPGIHCSAVAGDADPSLGDGPDADGHVLVTSGDCDPTANPDAGRVYGSGINPEFKPKCDTNTGYCVPTVDVTAIK